MPTRTVVVSADTNALVGDETYEAWLKHSGVWTLVDAGPVEQVAPTQSFTFPGLTDGDAYSVQLRMVRAGRYRVGYLGADPETWPSQSRIDFTVGSLIGVGAPTLTAVDDWVRTSAVSSKFTIHITPNVLDQNIELVRDGTVIYTFIQPHAGPLTYDDVNPPLGVDHAYKARHISGTLGGAFSAIITKFAGPAPVAGYTHVYDPTDYPEFGFYTVSWTGDGRTYQIEDDYLCVGTVWDLVSTTTTSIRTFRKRQNVGPLTPPGITANFSSRIRAKVTSFGVDDYSDWSTISITMQDDDTVDGSDYNTCPP